ncbi:uncharacterized protein Z518_06165 [Rhinocladiella mackenziei CBS 650.93]|uniref:Uncharacterized protein n=1 Tax=Rhinocladiella mackenziei CBS 650.93 TaxID=1442369 RepID=A0A0D2H4E5_9EURO|nr:uncharacterized protein Z518_06165 [Rhinocladiella mackenziei CBS 650.93]KIX05293.1 hypothetical protein Z518_06165 [Rhinocladiella mackenziei CBS 650.93]
MAGIKLQPTHPLAMICRQLAQDNGWGAVSETALNLSRDLFVKNLGRGHSGTFAVHRSLICLLPRDKQLEAAKRLCEDLVNSAEQELVAQSRVSLHQRKPTSISMTELCIAMTELVHIYIDMEDYGVAQELCLSVVQNYKTIPGVNFPDSRAAYAMEDMEMLKGQSAG